jgi:NADPH:quinone reductase-like Zn-dependent oxidoreductase
MEALVLTRHGNLDQVAKADLPVPSVGPDQVLVKIKAAALNRLDLWVIQGWRVLDLRFPHILGSDGSGIIVETGSRIEGYKPGDRVAVNPTLSCGRCTYCVSGRDNLCDNFALFGEHRPGFYAEYQLVPGRNLLPLPDHVSFETAAAASLVYVTAWHSLIEVGRFRVGEDILVIGAGGGVNSAYIDIAKLAGAGRIYVVGSSNEKLDSARKYGADVTINRNEEDWSKAVYQATDRRGVDVVVDNVGAATFQSSLKSLKRGGRLLTVGNSTDPILEIDNRYIFGKHLRILGSTMGPRQDYRRVMELVFTRKLKPLIDTVYPLADGLKALHRLESGKVAGKLILRPSDN